MPKHASNFGGCMPRKPTTIDLERAGMRTLLAHLDAQGRVYSASDVKRYDLIVDSEYAELKATTQAFFGLTESQHIGLKSGELARVFVVNGEQVTEYTRAQLLAVKPKPATVFYYYRHQIPHDAPE